jgi:hypothetical protein
MLHAQMADTYTKHANDRQLELTVDDPRLHQAKLEQRREKLALLKQKKEAKHAQLLLKKQLEGNQKRSLEQRQSSQADERAMLVVN